MNIAGIGPQVFIIIGLALLLFGPKKMVAYAYQAGKILGQLRRMYDQTMAQVEAEMKETGLKDIADELKKNTRDIATEAQNYINTAMQDTPPAQPVIAEPATTAALTTTTAVLAAEPSLHPDDAPPATPTAPNEPTERTEGYDAWLPK